MEPKGGSGVVTTFRIIQVHTPDDVRYISLHATHTRTTRHSHHIAIISMIRVDIIEWTMPADTKALKLLITARCCDDYLRVVTCCSDDPWIQTMSILLGAKRSYQKLPLLLANYINGGVYCS